MNDTILIIGASSELGYDLMKNLDKNINIIAHYNSNKNLISKISREIPNSIFPIKADLSLDSELIKMLEKIENECSIPNRIVHFAGRKPKNIKFKDLLWSDFQNEFDVSFKSLYFILNRILPQLSKKSGGRILVVLSSYVFGVPPKYLSNYTSVKYAMLGLVKSLAAEYAEKNIQINSLSPSMVETKFLKNINSKIVEYNAYKNPMKRNMKPSDLSQIIKFILFDNTNFLNGANIPVTGGSIF